MVLFMKPRKKVLDSKAADKDKPPASEPLPDPEKKNRVAILDASMSDAESQAALDALYR
jgi:hypothetical protein